MIKSFKKRKLEKKASQSSPEETNRAQQEMIKKLCPPLCLLEIRTSWRENEAGPVGLNETSRTVDSHSEPNCSRYAHINNTYLDTPIEYNEVKKAIEQTSIRSAPGLDQLSYT